MNAGKKKLVSLLVTFFALVFGHAQKPGLYFKRLNQASGLSNNKVNCILQDKQGFIWVGTDDGLNRYDGNNFIVLKNIPGQSSSISGNTISDIHEDKEGILWIATADGGISSYDRRMQPEKQFSQFKHQPGDSNSIPVNIVNDLAEDKQGYLWLATSGAAVLRFDKKSKRFLKPARIGRGTIYDLSFDKTGLIWAGREGGSIMKVDPVSMTWQADERYSNLYANLPHVVVTSLFRDSRDNIWFGSWDKAVYRHNSLTGSEEAFVNKKNDPFSFGADEVLAFNEDKKGRIWIGGKYSGLYIYDPAGKKFYNYRHDPAREGSLSGDRVNCIFIDATGMAWVGTNNGISIYHAAHTQFEQQFLPAVDQQGEKPLSVYDFFKDDEGVLWIGTSKGLYLKDTDGNYRFRKIVYRGSTLAVTRFYKDEDGTMYLGTDYSLFRYDAVSGAVTLLSNTEKDQVMMKLIESRIVSIVKDTIDGNPVLLTTPYGHFFSYYDLKEQRWVSRKDTVKKILGRYRITDNLIRKIVKTSDGRLWMANAKSGLVELNKNGTGSNSYINDPSQRNSISNNNVYDIKEDSAGNLWISTYGGGLNHFDTRKKTFRHFESVNNLIEGLETDGQGNVWSISNGNLQRFDPNKKSFTYIAVPDVEKSGGVRGNIYKAADGKMYVAGTGYFIEFDPARIMIHQAQPQVLLTDLSIFNHSFSHLLMQNEIALKHTQNFFTIHFAAPFYTASSPVQYSYMLEGVDNDWVHAGSSTDAPYTNLSAGEYVFKVRATATPGTWSDKITTIKIRIIPPVWNRWWFFVVVAVLLGIVAFLLYRYRINELLKRQAIRNKIAQDLHDSVGSTLSSISVYSQVAKIYKEKNRELELQATLEKISDTSGEMISEMNDIVWAINPRNDSMEKILQRMESFAKPLLQTKDIAFRFSYDRNLLPVNLTMEKRKNFYLIFKEAINNVLKYSNCKNLEVGIRLKHQHVELTVKDDGRGFDVQQIKAQASKSLSGNGLNNMKRRAQEMKGECYIQSDQGRGTVVSLKFPIT
jgi:signal transduction histidine kinase/ligand-binding sensor domain-containing protein